MTGTTGPIIPAGMATMIIRSFADFDNTSMSAYGELEFDISDRVTLKGGYRWGHDNIQGRSAALLANDTFLGSTFRIHCSMALRCRPGMSWSRPHWMQALMFSLATRVAEIID